MKATISPSVGRTVTLEMSEADAKYLLAFFGRVTEKEMVRLTGYASPLEAELCLVCDLN